MQVYCMQTSTCNPSTGEGRLANVVGVADANEPTVDVVRKSRLRYARGAPRRLSGYDPATSEMLDLVHSLEHFAPRRGVHSSLSAIRHENPPVYVGESAMVFVVTVLWCASRDYIESQFHYAEMVISPVASLNAQPEERDDTSDGRDCE